MVRVKKSPRSLKTVLSEIEAEFGVALSIDTLKLIYKQAGFVWKRVRKSLRKKRNQEEFDRSKKEIDELIQQHQEPCVILMSQGFTLCSLCMAADTKPLPSSKSKRLNVLGFVNRDCEFNSFVFEGGVNTSIVTACIDEFSKQIKRPTTLVIDNASTHTSNEFSENLEKWKERE